ncbi:thioredoxin family protein [Mesonia sp. MT50]|uniref:Thioredoxin family protein n=1 Tax=Mesonia profundi TaxID=3070998 RepID=A0ABU1A1N6_9FLAO|nr:thioredoxin family protein [Mesonia profundi]MDQ7916779.1 thioredoxin family protein [Mesonia profundi]
MKLESSQVELGKKAPDFSLLDASTNNLISLAAVQGERGTVVMFICNHCPFVKHVVEEMVRLANDYRILGFGFVAISSNDAQQYPQDGLEHMWDFARENHFTFPYLYDESQRVAKAYDVACTPDFYVYDAAAELVYHGQLDDSRPQNGIAVNGRSVREILDAIFNSRPIPQLQKPSVGCGIKWK